MARVNLLHFHLAKALDNGLAREELTHHSPGFLFRRAFDLYRRGFARPVFAERDAA